MFKGFSFPLFMNKFTKNATRLNCGRYTQCAFMKIIPLNTVVQRIDSIKTVIEKLIAKKEVEVKETKEEYSSITDNIKGKSQELVNDLQLSKDFALKSNELREMVGPKLDNWGLNKNVKTIIRSFITTNNSLANNYQFACKKSLEMHTKDVAKIALEKVEMKKANLELMTQNLRVLELQYNVLTALLKEYEQEHNMGTKELIHEKLSEICSSIENDKFFDYLFDKLTE